MTLSDYRYGSNAQREHNYSLHSLPIAEDYGKRPVRTLFHFRHTNLPENLDVKWVHLLSLTNLWSISKVKLVTLLLGLTLTFLIMASYILAWDKKGLLFTPSPYQVRPAVVPTSTAADAEVSSGKNSIDIKLLVKIISSKLEYPPRKVPDEKDITKTDDHLFSVIPRQFLPSVKSPCWYEEFSGERSTDLYRRNLFTLRSKSFKTVCDHLMTTFHQHLRHRDSKLFRLRCLPYFYIIGQPKCGTTDLFHRLLLHPEIKFNIMKEPHWWTRKRFGYIRFKDGFQESFPVEDYLDLFDLAAHKIREGISGNSSGNHSALQLITGEASASTMWDNQAWSYLHGDKEEGEPPFLAQDFIHTVQPSAKIIIMLRDPVERLYSDYLYFKMANKSAEDFHVKVVESVQLFQSCLSERTLRSCAYNTTLSNSMPVRLNLGMYIVFLLDWLTVFHREQILVLRLEDYAANLKVTIKKVFDFLSAGPLLEEVETALTKRPMSNTRRAADRSLGPMLPATRDLLREFHQPFNQKLASVLGIDAFLWSST
ncbi:carbohydrate sulfotransferase 15-like [Mastacembelus armatus]|uniref:Sulfotransferase n=1 Tax=Mastacembelus armatus TaxID=205130 RepID=A0A3Q3SJ08_9TELE|nr:carbohydrate sulfotransferase 15-like [Mastacembelus armatus]XP_026165859.1 carbohydrate sulfotransferase 15-like [Mastacembelus armatus]XP_026165860.1 carbohydrate sulfotransferase 15-like [Mastacembelus armatus]XP_026165861.1 carbohydrate sulfotransferase 15-like [Mastacembelus armatus]XP_026165862.1 carbohydrate sulfotransferase 15-like [Mastacembelus armatus]XP_026165863.1 carbohydrate sulfotransferase 15-like [Mastacembelus armatus]XP_026165864.1 carbohydrate sulfotransferase 15-like 